jgi:ornithine carbamoyltransferase
MKVAVYFEAKVGAHMVALFDEEATYMACLPALEKLAKSNGYAVTESLDFEDPKQIEIDNLKAELKYFYGGGK